MQITAALVSSLFPSTAGSAADTLLSIVQGRAAGTAAAAQRDPIAVLAEAEKNADKQIAAKAQEPIVRREIDAFVSGVLKARSVDELFADPAAMKVILTANGLEEFAGYKALYTKALTSDTTDPESLAVRLADTNPAWFNAARTYDFFERGLAVIQTADTVSAIADAYAEVRWRESLDASAPGVSNALSFKSLAPTLDTAFKVLGNAVAREVVTTALGLPQQLAFQSLEAQSLAITSRIDIEKFKDPVFVDRVARQYLIRLNLSGGGLTV